MYSNVSSWEREDHFLSFSCSLKITNLSKVFSYFYGRCSYKLHSLVSPFWKFSVRTLSQVNSIHSLWIFLIPDTGFIPIISFLKHLHCRSNPKTFLVPQWYLHQKNKVKKCSALRYSSHSFEMDKMELDLHYKKYKKFEE